MKLQTIDKVLFLVSLFLLASVSGHANSETISKSPLSSKPQHVFLTEELVNLDGPAVISKFNVQLKSLSGRIKSTEAISIQGKKLYMVDGETLHLDDGVTVAVQKDASRTIMSFELGSGLTLQQTKTLLMSLTYQDTKALGKDKFRSYLDERELTLQLTL